MARELETDTIDMPSDWACYLINGDCSGMGEADIADCDAFVADLYARGWRIVDCGEETSFRCFLGLGTTLATYTLLR